jgi:hypothetical protein
MCVSSDRLVRAYQKALGLSSIYILGGPNGLAKIGSTSNLATVRRSAALGGATIAAIRWCASERHARFIISNVRGILRQHGRSITPPDAAGLIDEVAAELGITLETDAELQTRAASAVHAVELELRTMLRNGQMKEVNARYRAYRLAQAAEGKKAPAYRLWLANYRAQLIREAAGWTMALHRDPGAPAP